MLPLALTVLAKAVFAHFMVSIAWPNAVHDLELTHHHQGLQCRQLHRTGLGIRHPAG